MEKLTPLLSQYKRIKEKYKDAILLFRLGDFYETFYEDAKVISKTLGLTLTSRPVGKNQRIPLAGIPHKSLEGYLSKLVRAGFKVAICEQLEDPRLSKGIVKRDVVEVITPGTILRPGLLKEKENNFLASIIGDKNRIGLAFADLSTGEFFLTEINNSELKEELDRLEPKEILCPHTSPLSQTLEGMNIPITFQEDYIFIYELAYEKLCKHFGTANLQGFGCEDKPLGIRAAGALLDYLEQNQRSSLPHLRSLKVYSPSHFLLLDRFTRRNLELTQSIRDGSKQGSLLSILDYTLTPPGNRLLKKWLLFPLLDIKTIHHRQDAIAEFLQNPYLLKELQNHLRNIGDLERLSSRIACEKASPREFINLKDSLKVIPDIKSLLKGVNSILLKELYSRIEDFSGLVKRIEDTLVDNPPNVITEGGLIKSGIDKNLDELKEISQNVKEWIIRLQEEERRRTGIPNLRINYNSVFGYYIEVTKSYLHLVPKDYIRKQTLVGSERFITPKLKEYEAKVLNAEERIKSIEYEIFLDLRKRVAEDAGRVQDLAQVIAELDVLSSLATASRIGGYKRPEVFEGDEIMIKGGRHPVVERLLPSPFIPNDTYMDTRGEQILLITGPNMSGKSTYLRQVALIVILAQLGSFVPAEKAKIGVVDKIFTRIGASDDLSKGVSTFLAEMIETANILNNATQRSLIILDEIGRGTATYDGLAIAWAVVEYLHENPKLRAKTLFATHYHELTEIAKILERVKNYHFTAKEYRDEVIFLRKLYPGPSNRSYGIEVAKLAGLPEEVTQRAKEVIKNFEKGGELSLKTISPKNIYQLSFFYPESPIVEEIRKIDLNRLSPIQALNKLAELKKKAEGNQRFHIPSSP